MRNCIATIFQDGDDVSILRAQGVPTELLLDVILSIANYEGFDVAEYIAEHPPMRVKDGGTVPRPVVICGNSDS
jgi:hypothetical protein